MKKLPVNKKEEKKEKRIMKEYSPKKRRVKGKEEYSVLKPLTNSDSPSVKSKGARLVSAKITKTQQGKIKKLPIKYSPKIRVGEEEKENLKNILNPIKKKKRYYYLVRNYLSRRSYSSYERISS